MEDMIVKAEIFATQAHALVEQKRKYTGEDYIVHPIRVAKIVEQFGGSDDQIAAAFLHDVVEDTDVDILDVRMEFGNDIGEIVDGLTDVSQPSDGNRKLRKAMDRAHSADASAEAQFVKCADIIDNSADISANDPNFSKVYKQEMLELLTVMDKVSDTEIFAQALRSVQK
jgi:(p)ppGpp synthase/HD superfamily hydrolase